MRDDRGGGSNTFKAYLNGSKYLMAIGRINIAGKEVWKSVISGLQADTKRSRQGCTL